MWKNGIVLAVAAALAVGCGSSEDAKKAEQAAVRKTEWAAIEVAKKGLDAQRAEVAALAAQVAAGTAQQAQLDAANAALGQQQDAFSRRLVEYINADPPVQGEPLRPDQLAAMRMNSAEGMLVAREHITLGGDYRKAAEIYRQLLDADPDNEELKSALAEAERLRFMTAERFAAVKKGMSEAEVTAALGRPIARNVRTYPERKVTAWFYPKDEQGNAAGVFFNEKKIAYLVNFDAVKAGGQQEEAKQ